MHVGCLHCLECITDAPISSISISAAVKIARKLHFKVKLYFRIVENSYMRHLCLSHSLKEGTKPANAALYHIGGSLRSEKVSLGNALKCKLD